MSNPVISTTSVTVPAVVADVEILDWDVFIEEAPERPHGVIRANLIFAGRDRPIPVEAPPSDLPNHE